MGFVHCPAPCHPPRAITAIHRPGTLPTHQAFSHHQTLMRLLTMRASSLIGALAVVGLSSMPAAARAQDPLTLYPKNYTVLVENDEVRVLSFFLAKGDREEFHQHPANVAVFLNDFTIRFTFPDGRTGMREGHPGVVAYSDATVHASENIGDTDAHGIIIELKRPGAGTGKATSAAGGDR